MTREPSPSAAAREADARRRTTLLAFLDHGGNYDATAHALTAASAMLTANKERAVRSASAANDASAR